MTIPELLAYLNAPDNWANNLALQRIASTSGLSPDQLASELANPEYIGTVDALRRGTDNEAVQRAFFSVWKPLAQPAPEAAPEEPEEPATEAAPVAQEVQADAGPFPRFVGVTVEIGDWIYDGELPRSFRRK